VVEIMSPTKLTTRGREAVVGRQPIGHDQPLVVQADQAIECVAIAALIDAVHGDAFGRRLRR
jgi:hypothetical protein